MTDPVAISFEPRFCGSYVADLTAGCSFRCLYCPFADIGARRHGATRPTALDASRLDALPAPPHLFLSPASDAFTPQAAPAAHALLAHVLPRGTVVGIVTKGIVPDATLALLARYREQVEGVAVGLTSLSTTRNAALEPGCPGAQARLANLARIAHAGLRVALRMDPIFPDLDDLPGEIEAVLAAAARRGATSVVATYVFAWGRWLRRLRREPIARASCAALTERAPMEGGTAFSVPLGRKLATYERIAAEAARLGMRFGTCGCKDVRLAASATFHTTCRDLDFWEDVTRTGARPAPAPGGCFARRAAPPR
jgi:DNA repair photolyase